MIYLAILDYDHLDDPFFMKQFATALSNQKHTSAVIVHGDSAYTDRIMQTGVMREEARIRSIKDLNHRLVALLADHGESSIGLHGYQKELVQRTEKGDLKIRSEWFEHRPPQTHLIISNLVHDSHNNKTVAVPLAKLSEELLLQVGFEPILIFPEGKPEVAPSSEETKPVVSTDDRIPEMRIPEQLKPPPRGSVLCSLNSFSKLPDRKNLHSCGLNSGN